MTSILEHAEKIADQIVASFGAPGIKINPEHMFGVVREAARMQIEMAVLDAKTSDGGSSEGPCQALIERFRSRAKACFEAGDFAKGQEHCRDAEDVLAAVAEEREACLRVIEATTGETEYKAKGSDYWTGYNDAQMELSQAIRSRSAPDSNGEKT